MIGLILSCGLDSEDRGNMETEPVQFISAKPDSGSPLHFNESVTVIFNRVPEDLIIVPGTVKIPQPCIHGNYHRTFSCW